jgi:hypothetical protein
MLAFAQTDDNDDAHSVAVTVPSFAILDIEPAANKNITLAFTKPDEAGLAIVAPSNDALWLNYSSILTTSTTRTISVSLSSPITGFDLSVTAAAADGQSSGGALGQTTGAPVVLTTSGQNLITGIGSSYTGDGVSNVSRRSSP